MIIIFFSQLFVKKKFAEGNTAQMKRSMRERIFLSCPLAEIDGSPAVNRDSSKMEKAERKPNKTIARQVHCESDGRSLY